MLEFKLIVTVETEHESKEPGGLHAQSFLSAVPMNLKRRFKKLQLSLVPLHCLAVGDSITNEIFFKEIFRLLVSFFIHSNRFSFAYWI